ncbi:hypothetical protein [Roseimarinus sediminis]|jgi:hypothetical protein|uniref:hypothetical protein n=1 Tax=Roseimarinus sediminis TaxID=1610899 RepID=UPI003D225397
MSFKNLLCVLWVLVVFSACNKEPDEIELIRPRIDLSHADLPALEKMGEIQFDYFDASIIENRAYYGYRWSSDSGYCHVQVRVFESSNEAYDFFISNKNGFSNERNSYDRQIDNPAVVGNCSYKQGQEFIRNNLYVQIYTNDELAHLVNEIAQSVDEKILETESYLNIDHLKVRFDSLCFKENPAPKNKEIPIIISFKPNIEVYATHSTIHFEELVVKGVDFGEHFGIIYDSTLADPDKTKIGIEVSVLSNYGFCSDSTIYIQFE